MTHGFPVPHAHSPLSACRLSLDNTEAELHSLFNRTRSLRENIQRDGELCQQMEDFLQVRGWLESVSLFLASSSTCQGWFSPHGFGEVAGSHSYSPPWVDKRNFVFQCPFFAGLVFSQGPSNVVWTKGWPPFIATGLISSYHAVANWYQRREQTLGSLCLAAQVLLLSHGVGVSAS